MPASIERAGAGFVRAGRWVFGTGLRAASGAALFERMREALGATGSSLSQVVRLDQYYPDARYVPDYHRARKQAFGEGHIAPSTSVIVESLRDGESQMDVQVIASDHATQPVQAGLNRPDASGYTPCLRVGDLIFVAGQLARDATGGLAARGTVAETEYLLRNRFAPALEAAESGLDLLLKAQVYLSQPQDAAEFWRAWSGRFADSVPPTTVVPLPHPAFLTAEATVEINVIAAHRSAQPRIRQIAGGARLLDGLLFLPGLNGRDMDDVMQKARPMLAAAGGAPARLVRTLIFTAELARLGTPAPPFTAVKVPAGLTVDLWGYAAQP